MDFELSDEQKDVQKAAREFAQGEFDPDLALEWDQGGQFPESVWKKACHLGFIGIHYPEEFGGQGLGLLENVLVMEAFCRVDSGIGSALGSVDLGSEALLKFGSLEHKKQFLLPLTKGEKRMTIAFAESEDGRDFTSLSTVAEKNGGYLLRGKKRFVPNGTLAETFLILAREPKEGWVTLIVEKEWAEIQIAPIEKMGLRMIPFGDLHLKNVRVPVQFRLGRKGDGMIHAQQCLQAIGLRSTGQALGIMQGAFDRALQYSKQRVQFGKTISQFQAIRHKLAEMAVNVEVARWLTYRSALDYDQGRVEEVSLSITQLEVGRRMIGVVDEAVQIFGGYGYVAEQSIEHYFRDAWAIGVEIGTEEELKDIIAAKILGPIPKII